LHTPLLELKAYSTTYSISHLSVIDRVFKRKKRKKRCTKVSFAYIEVFSIIMQGEVDLEYFIKKQSFIAT
jgi:hypothetical protein